jgi:hypothetical protein
MVVTPSDEDANVIETAAAMLISEATRITAFAMSSLHNPGLREDDFEWGVVAPDSWEGGWPRVMRNGVPA